MDILEKCIVIEREQPHLVSKIRRSLLFQVEIEIETTMFRGTKDGKKVFTDNTLLPLGSSTFVHLVLYYGTGLVFDHFYNDDDDNGNEDRKYTYYKNTFVKAFNHLEKEERFRYKQRIYSCLSEMRESEETYYNPNEGAKRKMVIDSDSYWKILKIGNAINNALGKSVKPFSDWSAFTGQDIASFFLFPNRYLKHLK